MNLTKRISHLFKQMLRLTLEIVGALVNIQGELIGINTLIQSMTGGYVGYSFAVPSNTVRKIFEDILEYGDVKRVYLVLEGCFKDLLIQNNLM